MNILGISCFYHDSAACLVCDGKIIAAAQEERFSRHKHDFNFPKLAAGWCLKEAGINSQDLDYVVFYDKPLIKFERIIETYFSYAPGGIKQFLQAMPLWFKQKLWIPEIISKELNYRGEVLFCGHHESHAASAFYPSPFSQAAFLTLDGVGEWETASFGVGCGSDLEVQQYLNFPHSLGLLYSAFTYYTGFKVNSGEYKLMGLAPYGEPKYKDLILKEIMDLKADGSFKMNMKYFGYCHTLQMTNNHFHRLFGSSPRNPETEISRHYMDVAASIQWVTEEVMLRMARHVHKVTGQDKLCLAGGVALNCVGVGKLLRQSPFKEIWTQPASGDAGGAIGAALLVWHKYLKHARITDQVKDSMQGSFLGPEYKDEKIEAFLREQKAVFNKLDTTVLPEIVSGLIEQGKVVGWFQGKMEFGPRALGSRSILADARNPDMQARLNLKIKFRESFRPFAPTVLKEEAANWFELDRESPYMLLVAQIKKEKRVDIPEALELEQGFDKLKLVRSLIPAVTHVDNSARVQTIKREDNPLYYDTINEFFKKTGCPVIINTSFNVRGEPLVCTPLDAFLCFMRTEMDYLVMGSSLLDKNLQKNWDKKGHGKKDLPLD
jgi:carbamoyltransferase